MLSLRQLRKLTRKNFWSTQHILKTKTLSVASVVLSAVSNRLDFENAMDLTYYVLPWQLIGGLWHFKVEQQKCEDATKYQNKGDGVDHRVRRPLNPSVDEEDNHQEKTYLKSISS